MHPKSKNECEKFGSKHWKEALFPKKSLFFVCCDKDIFTC